MPQLKPVLWNKGTLLTPQHLQQQDRYLEDTLRFRFESTHFAPWGFSRLKWDRQALSEGHLMVTAASGILRDGLLFDIPNADAAPPIKPLAEHFRAADTGPLEIFLAVRQYVDKGVNIAKLEGGGEARYVPEVLTVKDESRVASEKPIQIARKSFRFLTENEPRQGYSILPIARIERTPTGSFQLDNTFIPPLLDFTASDHLQTQASGLLQAMTAKSIELSAVRREKNVAATDYTPSEIVQFWLLYTVNTHYPLLRHAIETRGGHPERLYSLLVSLGGSLTTFSDDVHPRDLPVYDHENLTDCFNSLIPKLRWLLDKGVPKNYVTIALSPVLGQPSIYSARLDDDRFFEGSQVYLALTADIDPAVLSSQAPDTVTVGAGSKMNNLIGNADPRTRIAMSYVARPPSALPIKRKHVYFRFDQSGESWAAVGRSRSIAAHIPTTFPAAQGEIVILFPTGR